MTRIAPTPLGFAPIESVADYVQRVIEISYTLNLPYANIWFRGISSSRLTLQPGVMWRNISDEESYLEEFVVSLPAYSMQKITDPWDLYCFMQHHGIPTRLLDWSKSPLAALFFALDFVQDAAQPVNDPVVWAMNPYKLNAVAHGNDSLFVPNTHYGSAKERNLVNSYLPHNLRPEHTIDVIPSMPIAIEPPFSNPRVLAQQGCFTVHGTASTPLNDISAMAGHLINIDIDPSSVKKMRNDLEQLGFRGEWIYQDLDRLSRRIIAER